MTMRNISITVFAVVAFGSGCKGKKSEPAENSPAPGSGSGEVAVATAKPVESEQPKLDPLEFDAKHVGPLSSTTKLDMAELQKLFPDAIIERKTEQSEGETQESFIVKKGGKPVLDVSPAHGWVQVLDPSLKDPKGIGLDSTYEALATAYPDLACDREKSGGVEGLGPVDVVACQTPSMKGVSYNFDLTGAKKPKQLAAAQAAAGTKISAISVMFGAGTPAVQPATAPADAGASTAPATTGPQVVTVDPSSGVARATACRGEDVTFVVPGLQADDWKVTKQGKGLKAPKREFAEKFLGPNAHAEKFTWKTKHFDSEAHEAVIEFTNKADNAKFTATINLMCD